MTTRMVPLSELTVAANPRSTMDPAGVKHLADSINKVGLLQPLVVVEDPARDVARYVLVAGHRRLAAIERLQWNEVEVKVITGDASRLIAMSLAENTARENLDPFDEGRAYQGLVDEGLTMTEIGQMIGRSTSHISKRIRLLDAPDELVEKVRSGELAAEQAYRQIAKPNRKRVDPGPKDVRDISRSEPRIRGVKPASQLDLLIDALGHAAVIARNVAAVHHNTEVKDRAGRVAVGLRNEVAEFSKHKPKGAACDICGGSLSDHPLGRCA